jgi:hypothetical protein
LVLGGETRKDITVSSADELQLEGSRGEANFVIKWPGSAGQAYIKLLSNVKGVKNSYNADDSGNFVTILAMECRNIEPIAWYPSFDFLIRSSSGKLFEYVDLSEKEWADYDEENDLSVSIMNLEYKIEHHL